MHAYKDSVIDLQANDDVVERNNRSFCQSTPPSSSYHYWS